jgi:hypothetical protein
MRKKVETNSRSSTRDLEIELVVDHLLIYETVLHRRPI